MYFRTMAKLNARRNGTLAEDEKGFTLIELLVVVIIIGILAAIAIPVYLKVTNNAKDKAAESDLTNVKTAIVAYETANNGTYPTAGLVSSSTALKDYVSIDGSNYAVSADGPNIISASDSGICIIAKSKTGHYFQITDSTSAKDDGTTAVTTCS